LSILVSLRSFDKHGAFPGSESKSKAFKDMLGIPKIFDRPLMGAFRSFRNLQGAFKALKNLQGAFEGPQRAIKKGGPVRGISRHAKAFKRLQVPSRACLGVPYEPSRGL
jgi:hypothetical protein